MAQATIRVKHNKLAKIAGAFPAEVSAALRRGAFLTQAGMQARAPVRTGFLRQSILTEGATPGSLAMEVVVGAEYGAYVEFGGPRNTPRSYTRETTAQTFPQVVAELKNLEKGL